MQRPHDGFHQFDKWSRPVFVEPARDPNPVTPAMLEGAHSVGIPKFENHNGRMMEREGGASITDVDAIPERSG